MAKKAETYDGFRIVHPDAVVRGETVSQWTEEWSKWWLLNPAENNPVNDDPTGAFAGLNNDDKVFFLAGAAGGDVERSFDVPFTKPLLIPLLNVTYFQEAEGTPGDLGPVDDVLDWIADGVMKGMYARIDGQEIPNVEKYLLRENDFTLSAPEGSLAETYRSGPDPDARGPYPSGTVGYWLMLDKVSKGSHTLETGGYFDWNGNDVVDDGEAINVTANIDVVNGYAFDPSAGSATAGDIETDLLLV